MHKTGNSQIILGLGEFEDWLKQGNFHRLIFVFDENTVIHCKGHISNDWLEQSGIIIVPTGESQKNLLTCEFIWSELMKSGADRKTLAVIVGGGMLTDIAGFSAATFKRGMPFVNVPTSLLAMVDASIGNKTGINFNQVKNQIGTFSIAEKIVIDPIFLKSLNQDELLSGFGEILKYGFILEPKILEIGNGNFDLAKISMDLIETCILLKNQVVEKDPTEKGWRQILNFGHTIGHGLEAYSQHTSHILKHGHAIALGMLAESHISQTLTRFQELDKVSNLICKHYQMPSWLSQLDNFDPILEFIKHDKKNENDEIRCTLLKEIGNPVVNQHITQNHIIDALTWMANLPLS